MEQNDYLTLTDKSAKRKGIWKLDTENALMVSHNLMAAQFETLTKQLVASYSKPPQAKVLKRSLAVKDMKMGNAFLKVHLKRPTIWVTIKEVIPFQTPTINLGRSP
jgi:hypothetical protein